jgi:hypothetical protein
MTHFLKYNGSIGIAGELTNRTDFGNAITRVALAFD